MNNINTEIDFRNLSIDYNRVDFDTMSIKMFHHQYAHNETYKRYCDAINVKPDNVHQISDIPFLPIQFFKTRNVTTGTFEPKITFESSGTTGAVTSKHSIKDLTLYEDSFMKTFQLFYGDPSKYCILGLLPSYLERKNASLVYMVDHLIQKSNHPNSGFYLNEFDLLKNTLDQNEAIDQKTILIGVTYALLDFAQIYPMKLNHTIIMETGGMKGRRDEIEKESLHKMLTQQLGIHEVHSEYGMTELLSQSYSKGNGWFQSPPWMKILLRATDNPLETFNPIQKNNNSYSGVVNIIDLANIHSCCFIATDDMGRIHPNGDFEITGRMESTDIRGCGLMYEGRV